MEIIQTKNLYSVKSKQINSIKNIYNLKIAF